MNNSLAKKHPELVREWSEKNFPLTPDKITYGSNKIVWWKADCGHEWQSVVYSRIKGTVCPVCADDYIFFDWEGDEETDHVGIVEKVENGTVYTVEGNSGDSCKLNSYAVGSNEKTGGQTPKRKWGASGVPFSNRQIKRCTCRGKR